MPEYVRSDSNWIYIHQDLLKHRDKIGKLIWVYIHVRANPGDRDIEISNALGLSIETVNRHAKQLAEMGLIEWDPNPLRKTTKDTIPQWLRWAVFERDNFTCHHCGSRRILTADHIIPEVEGGPTNMDNLQTLCRSCNSKKGVGKNND